MASSRQSKPKSRGVSTPTFSESRRACNEAPPGRTRGPGAQESDWRVNRNRPQQRRTPMGERKDYAYGNSDYLKADDLAGKSGRVVISNVEDVEFEKGLKPVLSFESKEKRLVVNATNFDILCAGISNNTKDWPGHAITLRGEKVRFKGDLVDSICVSVARSVVHSPYLMITSPQKDSGKSTLLGVLGFLTPRSLVCVGLNEAVLFRSIDLWTPTLIADEADTLFEENEGLRAVYNGGWTRGTGVPRCVRDAHPPKLFPAFCPRVLGLKGKKLPDTTLSRCIVIELKRKLPTETVADFDHTDDATLATLRRKLARWGDDNWEALAKAQPQIPAGFRNRVRRNWWMLLAIAEMAGADLPEKAQKAAAALEGASDATDIEIELLTDIKVVFDAEGIEEISTKALIGKLSLDEERPWATYASKGTKPITDKQLAGMLRKY